MSYVGNFKHIIYPGPGREPRVLKYRVAFVNDGSSLAPLAVIHLVQCDPKDPPPDHLEVAIDLLLNRIVGAEFSGIRLDRLRFVLETDAAFFEYPIEYSADDFQKRGNPVTVEGEGKTQVLHIDSHDVIGGSVPLFAHSAKRHGLSPAIADVLS